MKILKPGRDQKGWAKEIECTGHGNGDGGCGALLLVEEGDLYKTFSHCRDETEEFITFECIHCGVQTDLLTKQEPPYNISSRLPSKSNQSESYR